MVGFISIMDREVYNISSKLNNIVNRNLDISDKRVFFSKIKGLFVKDDNINYKVIKDERSNSIIRLLIDGNFIPYTLKNHLSFYDGTLYNGKLELQSVDDSLIFRLKTMYTSTLYGPTSLPNLIDSDGVNYHCTSEGLPHRTSGPAIYSTKKDYIREYYLFGRLFDMNNISDRILYNEFSKLIEQLSPLPIFEEELKQKLPANEIKKLEAKHLHFLRIYGSKFYYEKEKSSFSNFKKKLI
jgi:hypothetical protein